MKKLYFTEEEKKAAKAEQDRSYRERNAAALKAKKAAYYKANKESISAKAKETYINNAESIKRKSLEWKKSNKAKHNSGCMKRYAQKMNATPKWLSLEDLYNITKFYEIAQTKTAETGEVWHVDHIIPLQGSNVCGLHVPWNLQVITASENCAKRNIYEG